MADWNVVEPKKHIHSNINIFHIFLCIFTEPFQTVIVPLSMALDDKSCNVMIRMATEMDISLSLIFA